MTKDLFTNIILYIHTQERCNSWLICGKNQKLEIHYSF